ncbi:MAG TPA: acyl-CoA dehydrogenase family protein [Thermoplasmata archaeon]|nr:acyl-CoA dehydrogenase family protein [Thermoplasmata archaeon]
MARDVAPSEGSDVAVWRDRAQRFAREWIDPHAPEIDRDDRLPDGLLSALAASGLMGMGLPDVWGGRPAPTRAVALALEALSASSAAVATLLSVHLAVCAIPIAQLGTDDQRDRFVRPLAAGRALGAFALSEPSVGSDAAGLACRYSSADGGFVLNGSKMFITNAATAGIILAFATRDPSAGHRGISAFVVPKETAGVEVAQRLDKLGIRGSETTELLFQDARLPSECLLGREGDGLRIALGALSGGRVAIAACALGVARAGLALVRETVQAEPADWKRTELARSFVDYEAARALVLHAADLKDSGEPFLEAASAAKLLASQSAVRIAHRGFDMIGADAGRSDARANRLLRDARVFPIVEGTTEIQELILGRSLAGA